MPSFLKAIHLAKLARMGSKAQPDDNGVTPLDVIFSCSLCAATFSEIYDGHAETVEGLSDGINPKERLVTRLYVTSCCHVICSKHMEGGGPPFHPAGQRPRAPCPVCAKETGEDRPRELYSIRGFKEGEYDPVIPKFWFSAPPMKLDGAGKEMEALRFQYLALIRYSKTITLAYKQAEENSLGMESKLRNMEDLASREHAKALTLEQEVERLRQFEQDARKLERFQARLPAIEHYLKLIPMLVEQNDMMKQRLATLGFQPALEPIPNFKGQLPLGVNGNVMVEDYGDDNPHLHKTGSSHTVSRSAYTTPYAEAGLSPTPQVQRPLKRQRVDSPLPTNNIHALPSSRDMMPPPPKPLSKMKSMRKIIPTIRKKFSVGRSSPALFNDRALDADVQMYENGHWEPVEPRLDTTVDEERSPTRQNYHGQSPYMSGALPAERSRQPNTSHEPQTLPSIGNTGNGAEFTFRSHSPIKMDAPQASGLPTERSYIRVMDALSADTGLDLGLQDPRRSNDGQYPAPQQRSHGGDTQCRSGVLRNTEERKRWGQTFVDVSSVNTSPAAYHPDPLRSNPVHGYGGNGTRTPSRNPITPAPARFQRPMEEVDTVVSPFFTGGDRHSQVFSKASVAERHHSHNHSNSYPFLRPRVMESRGNWHEPRSLNGLSFMESPLNRRNEPINCRNERRPTEYMASTPRYTALNLDSRGLLVRPDTGRSLRVNDSAYISLPASSHLRRPLAGSQSAVPLPSFRRFSQAQGAAMSETLSGRSPIRTRSHWNELERAGVRSSYAQSRIAGESFSRNLYSSTGRRSIRR